MRSLLDALQAGRLIELTDSHKTKALEYLAALIEAIPDIGVEGGITENVLAREHVHNTGIGKGWACPHARASTFSVMPPSTPMSGIASIRAARYSSALVL